MFIQSNDRFTLVQHIPFLQLLNWHYPLLWMFVLNPTKTEMQDEYNPVVLIFIYFSGSYIGVQCCCFGMCHCNHWVMNLMKTYIDTTWIELTVKKENFIFNIDFFFLICNYEDGHFFDCCMLYINLHQVNWKISTKI